MTCEVVRLPDGTVALVRHSGRRYPKCSVRGCRGDGLYQCDALVGARTRTCDRYLCASHRVPRGPGVDFCPEHAT
jgi:hypothetical protein